MIDRLIAALGECGLTPSPEELGDALWLAQRIPTPAEAHVETNPALAREEPRAPPIALKPPPLLAAAPRAPVSTTAPGLQRQAELRLPTSTGATAKGLPFRTPAAEALPGAAEIARALRPLQRRVPSRRIEVLDEEATARRILDERLWIPVFQPARSRWLELALVIDGAASMALWHRTVAELARLFERLGAFRDVRVWTLDTESDLVLCGGLPGTPGPPHDPRELVDPTGRRLLLLVTDAVAPAFADGRVMSLLARWGERSPTALVQVLPERLWLRTALGAAAMVQVRASERGASNAALGVDLPRRTRRRPQGIPVPVVTLEPESLGRFARILAGIPDQNMPAILANPRALPWRVVSPGPPSLALDAAARVQRFDAVASPVAQQLARMFAAAPLSLPVMRLVRATMLPEATSTHLAEVFLGGLIEELVAPGRRPPPDEVRYDFRDGVRAELLRALPVSTSLAVLRRVSLFVAERLGQPVDFAAVLAEPRAPAAWLDDPASRPFAEVAAEVLRPLGGAYTELADRLVGGSEEAESDVEPGPEPPPFNGHWVLVCGSVDTRIGDMGVVACGEIGAALAESGYGVVGCAWSGVDTIVAEVYARRAEALGAHPEERILHVLEYDNPSGGIFGRKLPVTSGAATDVALARASAVVLIGGGDGTREIYRRARDLGKLVAPLPATGRAAQEAYVDLTTFLQGLGRSDLEAEVRALDVPCTNTTEAEELSRRVIGRLRALDPAAPPSLIALGPELLFAAQATFRGEHWRLLLTSVAPDDLAAIERAARALPDRAPVEQYLVIGDEGEGWIVAGRPHVQRLPGGAAIVHVAVEPRVRREDIDQAENLEYAIYRALSPDATGCLEAWLAAPAAAGRAADVVALELSRLASTPEGHDSTPLRWVERVLAVTCRRDAEVRDRLVVDVSVEAHKLGPRTVTLSLRSLHPAVVAALTPAATGVPASASAVEKAPPAPGTVQGPSLTPHMARTDHDRGDRFDVLIVTAVAEEYRAVLGVDTGALSGSRWEERGNLAVREFDAEGGVLRVGVTQGLMMGGGSAAIPAAGLVAKHGVRCLAMCGICAGSRGDVALGDVIVADRVWQYDTGKGKGAKVEGDIETFRLHPPEWRIAAERFEPDASATWVAKRPQALEAQGDWILERVLRGADPRTDADRTTRCPDFPKALQRLWGHALLDDGELTLTAAGKQYIERKLLVNRGALPEAKSLKIHVGPIASGNMVRVDDGTFGELRTQTGKILGVDMEAAALGALSSAKEVPFTVVMKAVTDYADGDKDDTFKSFAATASAEVLIAFVRKHVPSMDPKVKLPLSHDLFLAHAGADAAAAEQLFDLLQPDVRVWLDARSLMLGDEWPVEIPRAQRAALATVILVSSKAERAFYLRDEIHTAIALHRAYPDEHRAVAVFLEGRPADPMAVPFGLRGLHSLDAVAEGGLPNVARKLRDLVAALRARGGTAAPPAPVVPALAAAAPLHPTALYDRLCKLTLGSQIEGVILRAGLPRAQIAPSGAPVAQRALDIVQLAAQGGPAMLIRVADAIAKEAPWLA